MRMATAADGSGVAADGDQVDDGADAIVGGSRVER
jgi:hypothetical protein